MKIKTIPREYEAIRFTGDISEIEEFIEGSTSTFKKEGDIFILSTFLGNHGVDIGDYLYKSDAPLTMIHIIHKTKSFSEYFEVIE